MQRRGDGVDSSEEAFARMRGSGYTFEYGFGSLRSCAWDGGPCGCQDAGDGGGCGDFAESFGRGRLRAGAGRFRRGLRTRTGCRGGRLADQAARTTAQVLQSEGGPGTRAASGLARRCGDRSRGCRAFCGWSLRGCSLGSLRCLLRRGAWKLRASLHETAANHDDSCASSGVDWDGARVWVFLRQQLCEGEAQRPRTLKTDANGYTTASWRRDRKPVPEFLSSLSIERGEP